jgi:hypothetical protein
VAGWTIADAETLGKRVLTALNALSEGGRNAPQISNHYGAVLVRQIEGSSDWLILEPSTSATPGVTYSVLTGTMKDPINTTHPGGKVAREMYLGELVHVCSPDDIKGALTREAEQMVATTEAAAEKARKARDKIRSALA